MPPPLRALARQVVPGRPPGRPDALPPDLPGLRLQVDPPGSGATTAVSVCSETRMPIRRAALAILAVALAGAVLASSAWATQRYRYPLRGTHNYGNLDVTGFGVKRADGSVHTGQD